jgi:Ni2+-binding GTPase involved in maturation of urease and hydrogenase
MLADSIIGLYLFCMENKIDLANYINIDTAYFQKKFNMSRPSLRVIDEEFTNDNDYNKV